MRILVVDDDAPNRKLLTDIASKMGECEGAEGGQEALSAFKKAWEDWRPFNLIFLDVLMPDLDGREVLLKIREIEKEKKVSEQHQVRVIMVTGVSEEETVLDCLRNGCDEFIVKPIDILLVLEKMKKLGLMISN
ncbi:MAG: response regulator [Desulfobacterales bacterium]|jgi:two-component system chemotaxis response regulator CheY